MILILAFLASAHPFQDSRLPIPAPEAQKESEKLLREVFKDDYAKKTPLQQAALAQKLLDQGRASKEDPVGRFVLYREARDLAAQAGDLDLAMSAVEAQASSFAVERGAAKHAVLLIVAKSKKTPPEFKALASLELQAAEEDDYETAVQAATASAALAKKAKELPMATSAEARAKEFAGLQVRLAKVKAAREKLATTPEDAVSNGLLGSYLCLLKGNWDEGLPYLAKGDDASLKALAGKDAGRPADPAAQAALGDGWWDAGEKSSGKSRDHLRRRAGHWYRLSVAQLAGLSRTKVEKRLAESGALRGEGRWVELTDWRAFAFDAAPKEALQVVPPAGSAMSLALMKFPPGRFTGVTAMLKFDAASRIQGGGLRFENSTRAAFLVPAKGTLDWTRKGAQYWDREASATCAIKDEYLMTVLVEKGELIVQIDGEEKIRVKTSLTLVDWFSLSSNGGSIVFDKVALKRED